MASKKSKKGKRYSAEEKQAIIDFVNEYNAAKGRGGAANASKKFGVSQLTVGSWLKSGKGGAKKKVKVVAKKAAKKGARRGRPPGRKAKVAASGAGDRSQVLAALFAADKEISAKRKELAALEAKFEKLKGSL
jgi:transposase-like protein